MAGDDSNSSSESEYSPPDSAPQFIIHIGRHKTGTTALQRFLAENEDTLASEHGVLYPTTGRDARNHFHHALFEGFVERNVDVDEAVIPGLLAEAREKGSTTIVISTEILSRPAITRHQVERLGKAFEGFRVKLVVYLRRQDRFLESIYAENIKRGFLAAPETIMSRDEGLDYHEFLDRYASVFGHESILVRSYEDALTTSIFEDFCSVLGLPEGSQFVRPVSVVNKRLPWRYLEMLRNANRYRWQRKLVAHGKSRRLAAWLADRFPGFMDKPRPLDDAARRQLLNAFEDSNQAVARLYLDRDVLFR